MWGLESQGRTGNALLRSEGRQAVVAVRPELVHEQEGRVAGAIADFLRKRQGPRQMSRSGLWIRRCVAGQVAALCPGRRPSMGEAFAGRSAHTDPFARLQASCAGDCPAELFGGADKVVGSMSRVGPEAHVEPSRLGRLQVEQHGVSLFVQLARAPAPAKARVAEAGEEHAARDRDPQACHVAEAAAAAKERIASPGRLRIK